jgi:hypothetical protein
MSKKQLKAIYEALIKSGDLLDMYPELSGEWIKDKEDFKSQYEFNNDSLLGDFEYENGYEY